MSLHSLSSFAKRKSIHDANNIKWTDSLDKQLLIWLSLLKKNIIHDRNLAKKHKKMHTILMTVMAVLTVLVGSSGLTSIIRSNDFVDVIANIFALLLALLNVIASIYNWNNSSSKLLSRANGYETLLTMLNTIKINPWPMRKPPHTVTTWFMAQYNNIRDMADVIPGEDMIITVNIPEIQ